jgi:hypothetical protein
MPSQAMDDTNQKRRTERNERMKKVAISAIVGLAAMIFLSGCLFIQLGGGTTTKPETQPPTVGQQLTDLKKAKDSGAITDAEYEAQKARVLGQK